MKLTSKIIIGLLALPFAAVIVGAIILVTFGIRDGNEHTIKARSYTSAQLAPFSEVKLIKDNDIWYGGNTTLSIDCDSAHTITYPAEWSDYLTPEVIDGVLTITLNAHDASYIYLDEGAITITAPAISQVNGSHNAGTINGFDQQRLTLNTVDGWSFDNCRIDSLTIEHPTLSSGYIVLSFNDTYAKELAIKSFSRINLFTSGTGRIDNCTWMPDSTQNYTDFNTYVKEANIGSMQWIPANDKQTFNLESKQQTSITFQK